MNQNKNKITKAVILAGGYGTRLSEETHCIPKPMIRIGEKPILWHIMKILSTYGINQFIICLGYKGYVVKEYFNNYFLHNSDVTFNMIKNSMKVHQNQTEPWTITLVDTGEDTMTGGRLRRVQPYLNDETFIFTYGDGLANINIDKLIDFHFTHKKATTITAVRPPGRFGTLNVALGKITGFQEKPEGDGSWINGGFFVLSNTIFDTIEGDKTSWELEPMQQLVERGEMMAYKHYDFWRPMDTLRDKEYLNSLWESQSAPWKMWE